MSVARMLSIALALLAAAAISAGAAGATGKLAVPVAADRAATFAKRTCAHDQSCVRSGVSNCRRESRRVVFCRIFLRRRTEVQGRYECTRLIRLAPASASHARVTGIGRWHCP
jgi:hypothetical protein